MTADFDVACRRCGHHVCSCAPVAESRACCGSAEGECHEYGCATYEACEQRFRMLESDVHRELRRRAELEGRHLWDEHGNAIPVEPSDG